MSSGNSWWSLILQRLSDVFARPNSAPAEPPDESASEPTPAQPPAPSQPPAPTPTTAQPPAPKPPAPAQPPAPTPAPPADKGPLRPRVLMVIYNPIVDHNGQRLIDKMQWKNPDRLAAEFMLDLRDCSGGRVDYQIVQHIVVDEFPVKLDGFQYRPHDYVNGFRTHSGLHQPDAVDYGAIIQQYDVLKRITAGDLDEVWVFGGPYFGFYESTMGGAGAFFCNAPPIPGTSDCPRRFVVMGFSFERGIGEMLEDLGHRAESTMRQVYRYKAGDAHLFDRFSRYDQVAPGQANVGLMHFAPNSQFDYDWGNSTPVPSCCDDWLAFPKLPDPPRFRKVTTKEWGGGDIREHHKWWFKRLPHATGATDGIANNWWRYVIDPNEVV